MSGSIRYNTKSRPSLFKWYERMFTNDTYTRVIGTFQGLFVHGGPYQMGVSRYFPPIIDKLINLIGDDHFMICPLYKNTTGSYMNDNVGGDFQIGITGTSYQDECAQNTLQREITEEVGLLSSLTQNDTYITHTTTKSTFIGTTININDTIVCRNNINIPQEFSNNPQTKVACVIHGTEQDMIDRYLKSPLIKPWPDTDMINGTLVIPVKMVKKYMYHKLPHKPNIITKYPILLSKSVRNDNIPHPWPHGDLPTRFTIL